MQSKFEQLLEKLNISLECKNVLYNCELKKIVSNKDRNNYIFYFDSNTNIPLNIYIEFKKELERYFDDVNSIKIIFNAKEKNNDLLIEYYKHILDLLSKKSKMLEIFIDSKVNVEGDNFTIYVNNVAELKKMEEYKEEIFNFLSCVGYTLNISILVDLDEESKVVEQIESKKVVEVPYVVKEEKQAPKPNWMKNYTPKQVETVDDPKVILGRVIDTKISRVDTIVGKIPLIALEVMIFGIDIRETKTDLRIFTLKLTDKTDSIYGKMFVNSKEEADRLSKLLKCGNYYKVRGSIKEDKYSSEDVLSIIDINYSDYKEEEIIDDALVKRVELHAHTMMSQMDGLTKIDLGKHTCELVSRAIDMGYRGVAITDHNGCQAFPIAYGIINSHNKDIRKKLSSLKDELENKISEDSNEELLKELEDVKEKIKNPPIFKGLYGTELTLVDDTVNIVVRPKNINLSGTTYVVFDTETTGFNAAGGDQMIEIGAVKIKDGVIIDRFDELINPFRHIPDKITELTCITDDMVKDKDSEENVTKRFLQWTSDAPMVAHNAKFDISFIEMSMKKYNLGEFKNTVIDTLELSRTLDQGFARHSLSALVKRYNVEFDEDAHHRADYDAEGTALVLAGLFICL